MEINTIKCKSGNEYNIVNETWETSTSWGHKSTLLEGKTWEIGYHKVKYSNRTWEYYKYQSCMCCLISDLLDKDLEQYINNYKENNDITRFSKGQKEEVIELWKQETYTKDLEEIKDKILNGGGNFD